jgi:hypothetical protein
MEDLILQTIYGIITTAMFICIIVITVQLIKIKKKLYDKSTVVDMMYEGEIAELAGDKTEALKWYYKALFWHWNDRYSFASFDNKFDDLIAELKSLYGDKIAKCGGQWPDRIKNPKAKLAKDNKRELNNLQAYLDNGAISKEEYEEEKAKLLSK